MISTEISVGAAQSPESPGILSITDMNFVGIFQIVGSLVLFEEGTEALGGQGVDRVIFTPQLVNGIQVFRTDLAVCLEADISVQCQKFNDVVAVLHRLGHVLLCPVTEGKTVIIRPEPLQSFQHLQKDALRLGTHLFCDKRVISTRFSGLSLTVRNDLSAKEANAAAMEGLECTVIETDEADIQLPLIALLPLFLQIYRQLRRDDGLDVVGLGQSLHLQIIAQHHQLMLQIRSGELVVLYLVNAPGVHIAAENGAQDNPNSGFFSPPLPTISCIF